MIPVNHEIYVFDPIDDTAENLAIEGFKNEFNITLEVHFTAPTIKRLFVHDDKEFFTPEQRLWLDGFFYAITKYDYR